MPINPKDKFKKKGLPAVGKAKDEPLDDEKDTKAKGKLVKPKAAPPMMGAGKSKSTGKPPVQEEPETEDNQTEEAAPGDEEYSGIPKEPKTEEQVAAEAEAELNDEIDANFTMAVDASREWVKEAEEDIEFKTGNQWTEEDRAVLEDAGRPCMTFNKIKPIVKLLQGHFIQNSSRIQVSPIGGEDQKFSEVADKCIQFIDEQAQLEFNLGYQFGGGETTGRAWIELYIDYEKDPIFGELRSIYHGRPGTIYLDPRCNTYDPNQSAQYLFKLVRKSKSELKAMYPKKAKEIDEIGMDIENPAYTKTKEEGDANNYGKAPGTNKKGINQSSDPNDVETLRQFFVKEYWRVKLVEKYFTYFVDKGDTVRHDTEEECQAEIEKRHQAYVAEGYDEAKWKTITKNRLVREMHVAVRCGGVILADGLSPFEPQSSAFPFFQYLADWSPEAKKEKDAVQGVVRCLKDPQREKNKSRSAFMHIVSTSANSGWIGDDDALPVEKRDELRQFGSQAGITIWKKAGSSLQRIEPVPTPVAQQVREKAASDDFKEVTGINSDLLSIDQSANPSGKAIGLRIRQALTILEPDFKNFRYTKKMLGKFLMQIFPTLFDVAKLKKILGEQYMAANQIDDVWLKAFLIMVEDSKFNVNVAEQGDTKTSREETFEDLMQMMEKGIQLPFELIADYMTFPNKSEVIQKVQAYQQAQQAAAAQAAATGA